MIHHILFEHEVPCILTLSHPAFSASHALPSLRPWELSSWVIISSRFNQLDSKNLVLTTAHSLEIRGLRSGECSSWILDTPRMGISYTHTCSTAEECLFPGLDTKCHTWHFLNNLKWQSVIQNLNHFLSVCRMMLVLTPLYEDMQVLHTHGVNNFEINFHGFSWTTCPKLTHVTCLWSCLLVMMLYFAPWYGCIDTDVDMGIETDFVCNYNIVLLRCQC